MPRAVTLALTLAVLALAAPSRADDATLAARDALIGRRYATMGVLLGWSIGSALAGGAALATDPFAPAAPPPSRAAFRRSFGGVTLAYALINAAIAVSSLAAIEHERALDARADLLASDKRRLQTLFLGNLVADAIYTGVGAALHLRGPSATARGAGLAFLTQGAFLMAFDASGALLSR